MRLFIYILLTFTASVTAYFFQFIVGYGFLSMLFTAAGSPPGDFSRSSYLFFTIGLPLAFGVCLWIGYYVLINIVIHFNIKLSLLFGGVLSVVLTIYLILCLLPLLLEDVTIPFSHFN